LLPPPPPKNHTEDTRLIKFDDHRAAGIALALGIRAGRSRGGVEGASERRQRESPRFHQAQTRLNV
jgi:hypothetical protein